MTASLLLLAAILQAPHAAPTACAARSGPATVPLVELYTSEGCSSCPPADRWLSRQVLRQPANWLAFHVDYWDSLGWTDRFAAPAWSRRQRDRAWAWSSATVYTPQVMVGTQIHAPWRSDAAFARMLSAARRPARAGLSLHLDGANGEWRARVAALPVPALAGTEARLWLARYVDNRHTRVRAGENRGATLRHDRVVRALHGPWPLAATATVKTVRLGPLAGEWGVVAFVQDARGDTLQSLALAAAACAPTPVGR